MNEPKPVCLDQHVGEHRTDFQDVLFRPFGLAADLVAERDAGRRGEDGVGMLVLKREVDYRNGRRVAELKEQPQASGRGLPVAIGRRVLPTNERPRRVVGAVVLGLLPVARTPRPQLQQQTIRPEIHTRFIDREGETCSRW